MSTEFFNDQWRIPSNENQNKVSNYSMDFNGSSDFIDCGSASYLNGLSQFSISCWFNLTTAAGLKAIVSDWNYNISPFGHFALETRAAANGYYGLLLFLKRDAADNGQNNVFTDSILLEDTWHHAVFSFNSGTVTCYINGSSVSLTTTGTIPTTLTSLDGNLNIGKFGGALTRYWPGQIDQVSIFDYALSQDQVTQLGAQGYAFASGGSLSGSIDLANPVALGTNKTVSFWFKLSSSANFSFSPFTSISNSGNCYYPYFINSSSTYKWYVSDSGCGGVGSVNLGSGGTVERNKWVHAAVVGNATNVKCYINGIEVNDDSNADRNPTIQRLIYGATQLIEFSNFSIFNTNLPETGTESISSLYNNGNPPDLTNYSNIIHWWKLDDADTFDGTDWTVTDYIGSNTGTSNGMNASNLVASNINGELIANPMITSPKPVAYYQLGDQSVSTGPSADYLVPNNSLSGYVFRSVPAQTTASIPPNTITSSINYTGTPASPSGFTVSLWVKDIGPFGSGQEQLIFDHSATTFTTATAQGVFSLQSGSILFRFGNGTYRYYTIPSGVDFDDWNNIVVYFQPGNRSAGKVWINGVPLVLSIGGGASYNDFTAGFRLYLNSFNSNVMYFKNYEIDNAGAVLLYNNGSPLSNTSTLAQAPDSWWKLNASEIFNSTSTEWSVDNNAYPSVYQSSLNFNGSSNYIDTNSTFNTLTSFTVSAWFKADDTAGTVRSIVSTRINGITTAKGFDIYISANVLTARVYDNGETEVVQSFTDTASWHNVVLTYNGTTLELFLDNSSIGTATGNYDNSGRNLTIGNWGPVAGASYYFDGQISNVAVYNTALTGPQVATLYNSGTPEASISHSPVSWWKLDNTTTGIQDSAGSNNGTNNGATEYAGFVNALAGESVGMDSSNLVVSDLQQTSGYSPYALSFDGANQEFDIPSVSTLELYNTDFTISFWCKVDANVTNPMFFEKYTGGGGWSLYVFNDRLRFFNGSSWFHISGDFQTVYAGLWTNVTIVGDLASTNLKCYINGNQVHSSTNSLIQIQNTNILTMAGSNGNAFSYAGELSNVAIWSGTALNAAQVTEVYNQGVPINLNTFSGNKPNHWWQLGSNSSFNSNSWTCLDEGISASTNPLTSAVSTTNMSNDDIVDGVGYSASGLGISSIDIKGDAPYSSANGLSENMDVLDRTTDVPS